MKLAIDEFLKRRKESKPSYVFDLREMDEYDKDHLTGAFNLPFEFLESNLARMPFSGDMLFYDGGEGVAEQAIKALEENGFSDFFYIEEGYEVLKDSLKDSPYNIRLTTSKDDSKEEQMEVIQNLLEFEINPKVGSILGRPS